MYTKFFKLSCKPFDVSPNPRFFYLNPPLKEILNTIHQNFSEPMAFIALTGGIGTGKTTFLNHLNQQFRMLSFSQPMFSPQEVFLAIKERLEVPSDSENPYVLGSIIAKQQKDLPGQKRYVVLAFDEAQSFSGKVLTSLRHLQDAVAKTGGKLPVLLSGHEELVSKISKLKFKPEIENHIFYYKIENFNFQDMQFMIDYRLKIAGSSLLNVFSQGAIEEVYKHSNGVPRLVNTICDLSLMTSFGKDQNIIFADTVFEAAGHILNLQGESPLSSSADPVVKAAESIKIPASSQPPDQRISSNDGADTHPGKRTPPFRLVKIAASVFLVLLMVGLSSRFLYKKTLDKNDFDISPIEQKMLENLPAKKDVSLGLGYTPVSDITSQHNNSAGEQASAVPVFNGSKEKVPIEYSQVDDDMLSEPGKGDMSFEMILSDRPASLPIEKNGPNPVETAEDNDIALSKQNQAIQELPAPEQTVADKIIQKQIAQIKAVPEQVNPEKVTLEQTIPEPKATEQVIQEQTAKIKAVPEQKKTLDTGLITLKSDKPKEQPKPQFNKELSGAIQKNDIALVNQLLAQGIDPDSTDEMGSPLLLKTAEMGNLEIFNALLKKGADINATDHDGDTPLMKAAWMGSSHVVSLLLEQNADINRQNTDGYSALFYGAINGHEKVVEILLYHWAEADLADINRKTPLMAAAWNGHAKIVSLLLDHHSNVNKKDKNSWTPLMFAAFQGHEMIFRRLIAAGSDVSLKNSDGYTSGDLAASQGHNELASQILN